MTIEQINDTKGRFYVDEDRGVRAPSVTSILSHVFGEDSKYIWDKVVPEAAAVAYDLADEPRSTAIDAAVRAHHDRMMGAADVGTRVHDLIWQDNPDLSDEDGRVLTCLESWDLFRDMNDIQHISDEEYFIGESRYGYYGGTYDGIVMINGRKALMELKTTWKLQPKHALQTAAYAKAMGVDECFTLRLGKYSPEWEMQKPRSNAWELFEHVHGLYVHMGDSIWDQRTH